MGKIYSTLRNNGPTPRPPSVALAPAPAEEEAPEAVGGDDVPFIEIGPRRKVEASPGVLAAAPPRPAPQPGAVSLRVVPEPRKSRLAPELVAFHAPTQPAAVQYADLLTALLDAAQRRPGACEVVLFSGVRVEAGCTTALLNVAIAAARRGMAVGVVDANVRRPGIASRLGLEDAPGLAEVLGGEYALEEAVQKTEQDGLTALTAGSPGLVDVNALAEVAAALRGAYDLVLIDGPRWDGLAGCSALAKVADAVFLVAPAAEADAPPASELMRDLPAQGVPLAGCVLTNG
jgi:Mrp family chromosome partitioning ATPase